MKIYDTVYNTTLETLAEMRDEGLTIPNIESETIRSYAKSIATTVCEELDEPTPEDEEPDLWVDQPF